ncbi:MAG: J domain-containing protein [Chloroflexi bacterium]|nr:MAG: J domain-containing protein [Chloroflexota bacterium]
MDDPYEVLGVSRNASIDEIKSAYRKIARETHPDLHGDSPSNLKKFEEATNAYAILSDPERRALYDNTGFVDHEQIKVAREEIFATIAYVRTVAAAAKAAARSAALRGLAWLIGGLLITVISYAAAASSPTGGSYVVMWGAILFGGVQALRGFAASSRIESKVQEFERKLWSTLGDDDSPISEKVLPQ